MKTNCNTTEYLNMKNSADVLQFAFANGMLNPDDVAEKMKKATIDSVLKQHKHPITESKDGRWRTYIPAPDGRRLIARKTYDSVVEALVEFYGGLQKDRITLADLFSDWIEREKMRGAAGGTIKYKESSWKNHIAMHDIARIPVKQIRTADIETWAYLLIDEQEMNRKRFYNIGGVVNGLLKYAKSERIIDSNPYDLDSADIKRKCAPYEHLTEHIPVFSDEEEAIFFRTAWECYRNGHHTVHKLIPLAMMFQFNTGLRISELCALRYEDIEGNILLVRRMYKESDHSVVQYTKNYKQLRKVPLDNDALKLIETAKAKQKEMNVSDSDYIFSVTDEPVSYSETKKAYTRYCELAGIPSRSSHSTRKTFITKLIDSGKFTVAEIAKICGNSEKVIFDHYYHIRKDISEKVDDINAVFSDSIFPEDPGQRPV